MFISTGAEFAYEQVCAIAEAGRFAYEWGQHRRNRLLNPLAT